MSFLKDIPMVILCIVLSVIYGALAGDVLVQLNVNRPLTDLNEKFVSFAVRPEDLYKALDGQNRKVLTRMASMLGDSYIRFVGDYFFAAENKLRNPTKIIWKGFNRWTRAVNWTMIIPVPYEPKNWDPVVTLKILNSSYQLGISDCIWQLGTDFGTSNARDYVAEMKTFNLMVDTFKPYVDDWTIIGADISAGSSAEETRRYVEMSKDLNTAFGWTYPSDMITADGMGNYLNLNDAALRMLFNKKVPVWLSLPSLSKVKRYKPQLGKHVSIDENIDALRWAQTLGEAATSGFNAIFKRLSFKELENPSLTFYVTALFKKIMGSRVFQARPLNIFSKSNKLYTHCANTVSGGLAFMLVNIEETSKDIVLHSATKMSNSDVWQYSLTQKKDRVYLNNEKLTVNSTFKPQIKSRNSDKALQLSAPGSSVTFWVLPNVDLEHCQYTEIEASEAESSSSSEKIAEKPTYSSSDRLIRQLIQDTALPHSALVKFINRRRRYATFANRRRKRFILADENEHNSGSLGNIFDSLGSEQKLLKKREQDNIEILTPGAFDWLNNWLSGVSLHRKNPLLKRKTRSAEDLFGPIFEPSGIKPKIITKKITEIRKPERKGRPLFEKFDEEEFFKKMGDQTEPDYTRLPDGDVHLRHIETPDGDEIDDERETVTAAEKNSHKMRNIKSVSKELESVSKPMRLLPTEFYESLPGFKTGISKLNIGKTLNSLLFAEPFSKKPIKNIVKANEKKVDTTEEDVIMNKDDKNVLLNDFLRAQKELSRTILSDLEIERDVITTTTEVIQTTEATLASDEKDKTTISKQEAKLRLLDMLTENLEHYFSEREEKKKAKKEKIDTKDISKKELKDFSWWNFGGHNKKRVARALPMEISDESWQHNMITKDDIIRPIDARLPMLPEDMHIYEYQTVQNDSRQATEANNIENAKASQKEETSNEKYNDESETSFPFVSTVKRNVSNFVNIVAQHVQRWYNTLTKHIEMETSSASNTIIINPK